MQSMFGADRAEAVAMMSNFVPPTPDQLANASSWTNVGTKGKFIGLLNKDAKAFESDHFHSLFASLADLTEADFPTLGVAIGHIRLEFPLSRFLHAGNTPGGRLIFYRRVRSLLECYGATWLSRSTNHIILESCLILYGHGDEVKERILDQYERQQVRTVEEDGGTRPGQANTAAQVASPRDVDQPRTELGQEAATNSSLPPASHYSMEQLQHALQLRASRGDSNSTQAPRTANFEPTPPVRREGAQPGATLSAHDKPEWAESISDISRAHAIRSIQVRFQSRTFSGEWNATHDNTEMNIAQVHLDFLREVHLHRCTEPLARSCLSYMYSGPAKREFNSFLLTPTGKHAQTEDVLAHMTKTYSNQNTMRIAGQRIRSLTLPDSETSMAAMKGLIDQMDAMRDVCPEEDRTDASMLRLLLENTRNVDWLTSARTANAANLVTGYKGLCEIMVAAAGDRDMAAPGGTAVVNFEEAESHTGDRRGTDRRRGTTPAPFDNRRLGRFKRQVQQYASARKNPIDKRTGEVMKCRSVGCGSTEHFQFSGKCPVEQRRRADGTSCAFMASVVDADLRSGRAIEDIMSEILLSQPADGIDDPENHHDAAGSSTAGTGFVGAVFPDAADVGDDADTAGGLAEALFYDTLSHRLDPDSAFEFDDILFCDAAAAGARDAGMGESLSCGATLGADEDSWTANQDVVDNEEVEPHFRRRRRTWAA
jgi:hypothetical protein